MGIYHVVFDLGGVLLEWEPQKWLSELFGQETSKELYDKFVSNNLGWIALDRGDSTPVEVSESLWTCGCGKQPSCDPSECPRPNRDYADKFMTFVEDCAKNRFQIITEGWDILMKVRNLGHQVHILSNFHTDLVDAVRKRHQDRLFRNVNGEQLISSDVHTCKPEADIYDILLERLSSKYQVDVRFSHLDAEGFVPNVVFLDDKLVNVDAAKQCRIRAIHVENFDSVREELQRLGVINENQ